MNEHIRKKNYTKINTQLRRLYKLQSDNEYTHVLDSIKHDLAVVKIKHKKAIKDIKDAKAFNNESYRLSKVLANAQKSQKIDRPLTYEEQHLTDLYSIGIFPLITNPSAADRTIAHSQVLVEQLKKRINAIETKI